VTDLDLYRQALLVVVGCFLAVGAALVAVIVWNAKRVITSVDELKANQTETMEHLRETLQMEMRAFDRRLTRVETIARVRFEDVERDIAEARRAPS